jgi:hypothetical protein
MRFHRGEAMVETADRLVTEEGEPALQQYRLLVGACGRSVRAPVRAASGNHDPRFLPAACLVGGRYARP